jgi:hypothetical protein
VRAPAARVEVLLDEMGPDAHSLLEGMCRLAHEQVTEAVHQVSLLGLLRHGLFARPRL